MEKKTSNHGFLGQKMIVLPNSIQQRLQKNTITKQFYITDIGFYPRADGHFVNRKKEIHGSHLVNGKKILKQKHF